MAHSKTNRWFSLGVLAAISAIAASGCSAPPEGQGEPTVESGGARQMAVVGSGGLEGQGGALALPTRALPTDYVVTPVGLMHQSCVMHIEDGERINAELAVIERVDGTSRAIPPCTYSTFDLQGRATVLHGTEGPRFDDGKRAKALSGSSQTFTGYVMDGYVDSVPLTALAAIWTVPKKPITPSNEVVFLFPGLQVAFSNSGTILQPVLQWSGPTNTNTPPQNTWSIWSFNCCVTGVLSMTGPVTVNEGDEIVGIMNGSGACTPQGYCPTWTIETEDTTTGQATILPMTHVNGQTFTYAMGGALEVYAVSKCEQLPASGSVEFVHVVASDYAHRSGTFNWIDEIDTTSSLRTTCRFNVSGGTNVKLSWLTR